VAAFAVQDLKKYIENYWLAKNDLVVSYFDGLFNPEEKQLTLWGSNTLGVMLSVWGKRKRQYPAFQTEDPQWG
jgi:hypothetical protein